MPEYPIPQDGEVGTWGAKIREALAILNSAIESNILSIQDINVFLNSMPDYVEADDYNSAISNINDELALKAESEHQHTLSQIEDLGHLSASVNGLPTISVTGLGKNTAVVTAIASLNTLAPLLRYEWEVMFGIIGGSTEIYYPKPLENTTNIAKPPADWAGWAANNQCQITLKVKIRNILTNAESAQASITVTCNQHAPVTAGEIAKEIVTTPTSLGALVDGVRSTVLVEVSAIQSAT
jgi:hypothetical protein